MRKELSYRGSGVTARMSPATLDRKSRSLELVIATETPVLMFDWSTGERVPEVLLAAGCILPDGAAQVPLLDTHSRESVSHVLGSVSGARVDGDCVVGRAYFSETPAAEETFRKFEEGHLTDFSAGYSVTAIVRVKKGETTTINGRKWKGPVNVVTSWTLKEVSCCPIGADVRAKVRAEVVEDTPQTVGGCGRREGETVEQYMDRIEAAVNALVKEVSTLERRCNGDCCETSCPHYESCEQRGMSSGEDASEGSPPISFEKDEGVGIGQLHVHGFLSEKSIARALEDMEKALPRLKGVFVTFDSPGGNGKAGYRLEEAIARARGRMPVVGFVHTACSAAMLPAAACSQCYIDEDGFGGGAGIISYACDGHSPRWFVNSQSQRKLDGREAPATGAYGRLSQKGLRMLQQKLDTDFERDLERLALYREVDADELRPFLDGVALNADDMIRAGLVDDISNEHQAYLELLRQTPSGQPIIEEILQIRADAINRKSA